MAMEGAVSIPDYFDLDSILAEEEVRTPHPPTSPKNPN
jgi:hypothetical protein